MAPPVRRDQRVRGRSHRRWHDGRQVLPAHRFREADIDERAFWSDYQDAYAEMLHECSTEHAPWYVVPSDHKWYRNWAISQILREVFDELDPQYPQANLDVARLRERLQPPH